MTTGQEPSSSVAPAVARGDVASPDVPLATRAARGASTTLAWQFFRIATQLISTILLARLLAPGDFGLFAMVLAVIGVGEVLRDLGLTMAAVQAEHLSQAQKSNLFWINLAAGLVLTLATVASSNLIASLYSEPALAAITVSLSATFLINSAATQFRAELNRNMRFMALNVLDTVPQVLGLVAAVVVALLVKNYWALVVQQLAVAAIGLVMATCISKWWPGLPRRGAHMGDLLRFGGGVIGTQLLTYATRNTDNIALGYVAGPRALGQYSRAYQVLELPIIQLTAPISRVAIPVLTRLVHERERYVRYLRSGQLVGSLVVGILYGLIAGLAVPGTRLIFGPQWSGAAILIQVLALGGAFRAMNQVVFWVYLSMGKSLAQLKFNMVSQPLLVLIMLVGLPWGAVGVAVGHTLGHALNWFASLIWCGKQTGVPTGRLMRDGIRNFCAATVPSFAISALVVVSADGSMWSIPAGVAAVAAYLFVLFFLSSKFKSDVHTLAEVGRRVRRTP